MMTFESSLPIMSLDVKRHTKTLDRVMGQIIREAAREWLRAILTSVNGSFPVLTGAAKSTLKPLGRFLRVAVPVTPQPDKNGRWRGDRRSLGEASSSFEIIDRNFEYSFTWSTDLLHYYLNEFFDIATVSSSPWHSLEAGERAFLDYVDKALATRVPDIEIDVRTEIL